MDLNSMTQNSIIIFNIILTSKGLNGNRLLAGNGERLLKNIDGHLGFTASTSINDTGLANRGRQNAKSIVQRTLCLVDDLLGGATDDNCAGFAQLNAAESQQCIVTDHNLREGKNEPIIIWCLICCKRGGGAYW